MELGTQVPSHSGWKPRIVAVIVLALLGVGLLGTQGTQSGPWRYLRRTSEVRYDVQNSTSAAEQYFCETCHGHDQDLYRDFMVNQWKAFYIVNRWQGYPTEEYKSVPAEALPHEFGLYDDCPQGADNWVRIAAISYMCLDYNKDVRNDQKGRYRPNQEQPKMFTSSQHFDMIKAQWSITFAQPYLQKLVYIKELIRYRDTSPQNSGFVAYQPGLGKGGNAGKEILVVVQGSMTLVEDSMHNLKTVGTNFGENVLKPLGIKQRYAPKKLRYQYGYSQIVVELYPQIKEAIHAVQAKYGAIQNITITGHSLGSGVGAGLLKVFNEDEEFGPGTNGILFAQPNAFKLPFFDGFFTNFWNTHLREDAKMLKKVINVHNKGDPVVLASQKSWYVPIGSELQFTATAAQEFPSN